MGEDERRKEKRRPVTLVVDYSGAQDLLADFTTNLSRGGTFIRTDRELAVGTRVELVLSFPGLVRGITIAGQVRWVGPPGDDSAGVGIQFENYTEETREQLESVIAAIARGDRDYVSEVVNVLLCEDNPHVAKLISHGLGNAELVADGPSYKVSQVSDGQQALDTLAQNKFDILVIDVYLPVLDGITVIKRIRGDTSIASLPIVAVSAGGHAVRDAALTAGADFFLDKPMRLREIVETMRQLRELSGGK